MVLIFTSVAMLYNWIYVDLLYNFIIPQYVISFYLLYKFRYMNPEVLM